MKAKLLPLAVVTLALAGCGSSGVVPKMGNRSLEEGYALLRAKGYRVATSIPVIESSMEGLGISRTIPAARTHLAGGSVVTLVPRNGGIGSPVGLLHPKYYRVPDFVGGSPEVGLHWAEGQGVYWSTLLPRLHGSTAPSLFDAYVVTAQHPAAGGRVPETGWLRLTVRPRR